MAELIHPFQRLAEPMNPLSDNTIAWLSIQIDCEEENEATRDVAELHNTFSRMYRLLAHQLEILYVSSSIKLHGYPAVEAMELLVSAAAMNNSLWNAMLNELESWPDTGAFEYDAAEKSVTISGGGIEGHTSAIAMIAKTATDMLTLLWDSPGWTSDTEGSALLETLEGQLEQITLLSAPATGQISPPSPHPHIAVHDSVSAAAAAAVAEAAAAPVRMPGLVRLAAAAAAAARSAESAALASCRSSRTSGAVLSAVHAMCSGAASDARVVMLGEEVGGKGAAAAAGRRLGKLITKGSDMERSIGVVSVLLGPHGPPRTLRHFFDRRASGIHTLLAHLQHMLYCCNGESSCGVELAAALAAATETTATAPAASGAAHTASTATSTGTHRDAAARRGVGSGCSMQHQQQAILTLAVTADATQQRTSEAGSECAAMATAAPVKARGGGGAASGEPSVITRLMQLHQWHQRTTLVLLESALRSMHGDAVLTDAATYARLKGALTPLLVQNEAQLLAGTVLDIIARLKPDTGQSYGSNCLLLNSTHLFCAQKMTLGSTAAAIAASASATATSTATAGADSAPELSEGTKTSV
jgi:hypothetical protein